MSTVGKVLSVLVVLMAVVWVMLSATVAQLNRNGTQAVEDLQKKVVELEKVFDKAEREFASYKDETHQVQLVTQNGLTVLQARQSDSEKALSGVKEILARVQIQLTDAENLVKSSEADKAQRKADQEAETKAKADAIAGVEKLKGENSDLLTRLTSLRDKFKVTLQENKGLVEKLSKSGDSKPAARPASL